MNTLKINKAYLLLGEKMSRLEKTIQKKYKKRKFEVITKILFMFCMILSLIFCIIIIDNNAKKMLGEQTYETKNIVNILSKNIKNVFDNISLNEIKDNIDKIFN